jgi:GNAT superfamily N-acetyltransferase
LIENVVVHADHRRRGLGKKMMRHAIDLAKRAGCYKVMLLTGKKRNHKFYESAGFKKGVKTGFVFKLT